MKNKEIQQFAARIGVNVMMQIDNIIRSFAGVDGFNPMSSLNDLVNGKNWKHEKTFISDQRSFKGMQIMTYSFKPFKDDVLCHLVFASEKDVEPIDYLFMKNLPAESIAIRISKQPQKV